MSVIDKIQINSTTYDVAADAGNVAYSDAATYSDGSAGKEISQLKSDIVDINVPLGTDLQGYYGGQVGGTISFTAQSTSHAYAINLEDYIGRTVCVYFKTTNTTSTRVTALCDDNGVVFARVLESGIASGWYITPSDVYHKLYISGSSLSSEYSVTALSPINDNIRGAENNSGKTAYIDATAASGGNGSDTAPFSDIQQAINKGYTDLLVKAGEYSPVFVHDLSFFRVRLWNMPTYSTSYTDLPKIKILATGTTEWAVRVQRCDHVELSDVWVVEPPRYGVYLDNVRHFELTRCYGNNNSTSNFSLFRIDNSNGVLRDCKAWGSTLDGFNFHGFGNTELFNCVAYGCGDDGASHHEGCTGSIYGGEFYSNGKAGLAPFSGSNINIYGAYCHDNTQYGIYASSNSTSLRTKSMIANCACKNNTTADIYVNYADVIGFGNIYDTKTIGANGQYTEVTGS